MEGVTELLPPTPDDGSRRALDVVHRLVADEAAGPKAPDTLLGDLAAPFAASAAGLADLADGTSLARTGQTALPWVARPDLLKAIAAAPTALAARLGGKSWLMAGNDGMNCLLWLEADEARGWTTSEAAALSLAATALPRQAWPGGRLPARQHLELAAAVTRRLAHDYGNILTAILGFTELIRADQPEGGPFSGQLAEVHRAAQQGARLTDRLRLYGKRAWPVGEPGHLAAAVVTEEARLREHFGVALRLETSFPADLPAVKVPAEPLGHLLAPLLDNAAEATVGRGRVRVTARAVTLTAEGGARLMVGVPPGAFVEVTVEDDGPGLPEGAGDVLSGEPFYSSKPRRSGLGLGIAYGIARCHGGGLAVGRGSHGGTVIRVYLPAAPPAPPRPSAGRVLVVDDDPGILQFVCATLDRAGFRVEGAPNGEEALKRYTAAQADPFQLVVADVMMPRMTGFDLADHLCRHDPAANVLFMSGQVAAGISRDPQGSVFALLTKPFRPDGLLRAVRAALERKRGPVPAGGRNVGDGAVFPASPVSH